MFSMCVNAIEFLVYALRYNISPSVDIVFDDISVHMSYHIITLITDDLTE